MANKQVHKHKQVNIIVKRMGQIKTRIHMRKVSQY